MFYRKPSFSRLILLAAIASTRPRKAHCRDEQREREREEEASLWPFLIVFWILVGLGCYLKWGR